MANNLNHFAENQLTKFSAGDAGDFRDASGEREMASKCGGSPAICGRLGRSAELSWVQSIPTFRLSDAEVSRNHVFGAEVS